MVERIQKGSETLSYISSPEGLVAMHISDDGDEMKYVLTDYLGTIYALVDDGAQSTDDALYYSFNAWGERRELQAYDGSLTAPLFSDPADYITSRGYTGHEHIDAFELINMNGRVYDPNTSSFLSPDPVMQSPDNPQNLNRYSYCLNNPTKYIDPSGFTQQKPPRQEWLENNYGFEGGSYFYRGEYFFYNSETGGFNGNRGNYHSGGGSTYYYAETYIGDEAVDFLRDMAGMYDNLDFPSNFYSAIVTMEGVDYLVTSKNPIGNYRIKYGGIIFPRGCSTHIVGPVIIEGSAGGGMGDVNFEGYAMNLSAAGLQQFMKMNGKELQNLQKTLEANNGVSSININNKILNNTKWIKRAGVIGNVANGFNVAFDIYQNGGIVSASQMVDGVAAVVAFVPGFGWMISSAISLTKDYTITMNQLSQKGISDFYLYSGFAGPRW